ncbi:hypothetical protein [Paracoccus litorisediminis]|uniref:Uncharacterized protein n=1 Tax=Paracoccus litorisediminis TaxID=2006130 RepID=A0A844HQV2_9RHOB|nr:hypothetical protein [Paracoccus litorisediminis]MTH60051.1 hypothetical protein [Paracoccus litorisediminis]
MGLFGDVLTRLASKESHQFMVVRDLKCHRLGITGSEIKADTCYIEIYLESLRIKNVRKFATSFHGVVYAYANLAREGDNSAEFAAVTTPKGLALLDPNNLDRVITMSKLLFGPTPWRGGVLRLELGLFSVRQTNLMSGVLDLVGKIADQVGVSFVSLAKPFLPLVREGMDLIAGQAEDSAIEVALNTDLSLSKGEAIAVIAVEDGVLDLNEISMDPYTSALLYEGMPLKESYFVFSIRSTKQKADYAEIPELKAAYASIVEAIRDGTPDAADVALHAFRRTAIISPDLITEDRNLIVEKASMKVKEAFSRGFVPSSRPTAGDTPQSLGDLRLYN